MDMFGDLFTDFFIVLKEGGQAFLPLFIFFLVFQLFVLKVAYRQVIIIFKGLLFAFLGLVLFLWGVRFGFLPVAEYLGGMLIITIPIIGVIIIGGVLGFVATIAEPAVRILCFEVEKASSGNIRSIHMLTVLSISVAAAVALGILRIVLGMPILYILIPGYIGVLVLTPAADKDFVSIAYDAGGTLTGPMISTFIMTMSLGMAAAVDGRSSVLDGFGMVALVALAPIMAVLFLGLIFRLKKGMHKKAVYNEDV